MSERDFAIIGLGNPGEQYRSTRHNVGFLFLDYLGERCGIDFSGDKWENLSGRGNGWDSRLLLVKPQTFMNRSGRSVAAILRYYSIPSQRLLVVHDDIDMHPGRIKLVFGGGTGGHNGIRSIVEQLGTKDFYRLKIGIGRPGTGEIHPETPVDKYVLSRFSREELRLIEDRFARLEDGVGHLVEGNGSQASTLLNSLK